MFIRISKTNFLNLLFCFIPISYIGGNLVLNLNILSIIVLTVVFYSNEVFKLKLNIFDKLIIFFFSYILLTALISGYSNVLAEKSEKDFTILIKTLAFFRFLIFYFIIKFLINKEIINFRFFFIFCTACTIFVCLDIVFQTYTGKDIFGYELVFRRASGPFDSELVAGSYLQRFSIFSFFLFYFYQKMNKQKKFNSIVLIYFALVAACIIFSGNKMPFILFLFMLLLIFIFENNTRKIFFVLSIQTTVIFLIFFYSNPLVKDHFGSVFTKPNHFLNLTEFKKEVEQEKEFLGIEVAKNIILKNKKGKIIKDHHYYMFFNNKKFEIKNTYMKDFYSGYKTWQLNKYLGEGIRSYRVNCSKTIVVNCSPHPHNYYLDILSNLGLIGFVILLILFFKTIFNFLCIKYFSNTRIKNDFIIIPFLYLFIIEVFPLRTAGSFFSTSNATFIFLVMSITIALINKRT